jgi:hypothetical protein
MEVGAPGIFDEVVPVLLEAVVVPEPVVVPAVVVVPEVVVTGVSRMMVVVLLSLPPQPMSVTASPTRQTKAAIAL